MIQGMDDNEIDDEFLKSDLIIEEDYFAIEYSNEDVPKPDKNKIMNALEEDLQSKERFLHSDDFNSFEQVLVISQIFLNFTNDDPFFRQITNVVKAIRKSIRQVFIESKIVRDKNEFKENEQALIRIFYQDINIGFITSTGQIKSTAFVFVRKEYSESLHQKRLIRQKKDKKEKDAQLFRITLHFYSPNKLIKLPPPNHHYKQHFLRFYKFHNEFIVLNEEKEDKKPYVLYHVYKPVDDQIYFLKKYLLQSIPANNVIFPDIFNNSLRQEYRVDLEKIQEAKNLVRLTHPNVQRTYDWWLETDSGQTFLYVQQEYCIFPGYISQARNLLSYSYFYMNPMATDKKLELIKELMLQIISGLEYLQKREISHGDLKPECIMVTMNINAETQVMIAEFNQKYRIATCQQSPLKEKEYHDIYSALGVLLMHLVFAFPGEPRLRNNYVSKFQHEDFDEALHLFDGWATRVVKNKHPEFSFFQYKFFMQIAQKLFHQKVHDLNELRILLSNYNIVQQV